MIKLLLLSIFIFASVVMTAQIGINNTDPKATLDVTANTTGNTTAEGIIAPRLTGDQIKAKDALYTDAQTGTLLYATAAVTAPSGKTVNMTSAGYYYFNGTAWIKIASPVAGVDSTNDAWVNDFTNTQVKLGTLSNGTTTRPTGTEFVALDNGNVGIGSTAPMSPLEVVRDTGGNVATFGGNTTNRSVSIDGNGSFQTAGSVRIGANLTVNADGVLDFRTANGETANANKNTTRILREKNFNSALDILQSGTGPINFFTNANGTGAISGNKALQLDNEGNANVLKSIASQGSTAGIYPAQGAYMSWNDGTLTGQEGIGYTNFVNHRGKGTGGFIFTRTNGTAASNHELMRIAGNGNVGIGLVTIPTTNLTPSNRLHVVPETGLDPVRIEGLRAGTSSDQILSVDATGVVHKVPASGAADTTNDAWVNDGTSVILQNTDGTPRLAGNDFIALDNGNVGIGTTAPSELLQVGSGATLNTTVKILSQGGNIGYSGIDLNVFSDLVGAKIQYIEQGNIGVHFKVSQGALSNTTASSIFIDGFDGNVGIGTTVPTNALDVNSINNPLRLRGLQTGVAADQLLTVNAAGVVRKVAPGTSVDATNDAWVNNGTRVELGTLANGTSPRPAGTQFVALDNGNVGVGTIAPTSKLQISGSFSAPIRSFAGQVLATDYTVIATGDVTLPSPVGLTGRIYNFVWNFQDLNTTFNILGNVRNDGTTYTSYNISYNEPGITVQSTGSVWIVISSKF